MRPLPLAALLVCACALGPSRAAAQALDQLEAVHPYSIPGAIAGSPTGEFLYLAEGGSIGFVHVPQNQLGFDQPLKRVPVGDLGVRPARLLLDPQAFSSTAARRLYVAGGQSGLWLMDANPNPAVTNKAARVDDAPGLDPAQQTSRRYCNDVTTMRVGGVDYLVALFARKHDTRLRCYPLADVRAVLASSDATGLGAELAATKEVRLARHPLALVQAREEVGESFGLAVAVDQVGGLPGQEVADVYVALANHGLVRVRFLPQAFAAGSGLGPKELTPGAIRYGPLFGDDTPYAALDPLYGHFAFVDTSRTPAEIQRRDRPVFADVAVQNDAQGHFLYAAVDHLNWVRFDLAQNTWNAFLPIDHHEGAALDPAAHPWGERQVQGVEWANPVAPYTYCRSLEVVPDVAGNGYGTLLVATLSDRNFVRAPDQFTPGFVFDNTWGGFGGVTVHDQIGGWRPWTVVYALDQLDRDQPFNATAGVEEGGKNLFVPPVQSNFHSLPNAGQIVEVAHNNRFFPEDPGLSVWEYTCYSAFDLSAPPPGSQAVWVRGPDDAPGRYDNGVGYSRVDPRVLLTAQNDGPLWQDGILVLDEQPGGTSFHPHTLPGVDDDRLQTGIVFNQDAQWLHPGAPRDQYLFGAGKLPSGVGPEHYEITRFHVPLDPLSQSPTEDFRWYLEVPPDQWGSVGRLFYLGAGMDTVFDAWQGTEWLWSTRQKTPNGLLMMRRDRVMNVLDGTDGPLPDGTLLALEDVPGLDLTALGTHPEFDGFPFGSMPGAAAAEAFWSDPDNGLGGDVRSFPPKLARVRGPGGIVLDHWVLVAPCGMLSADPQLAIFDEHPDWAPDPDSALGAHFGHALIQFWDVTDPQNVPFVLPRTDPAFRGNSPLPRIIGADPGGLAWQLETVTRGGRALLFAADFSAGALSLYDITEILQAGGTPPTLLARYDVPGSVFDDLPNNLRALAVDEADPNALRVYLGVPRAGIVVLRVDNAGGLGGTALIEERVIQTPGDVHWLTTRVDGQGRRTLLVSDGPAGLRVYGAL